MATRWRLATAIDRIEGAIGPAPAPPATDPFALVLWENVAYLVDDERRRGAFERLARDVGLEPRAILAAPDAMLLAIVEGMRPNERVQRLRDTAALALEHLPGPDRVETLRALPLARAKKLLQKFPGIGEPGAETILLLSGSHRVLGLESNGIRVLTRLGFGEEQSDYTKTYRLVRAALADQLPGGRDDLIRTRQLLRSHGQTLCRRNEPRCDICPLASRCPHRRA